jgi:hypothetical protein
MTFRRRILDIRLNLPGGWLGISYISLHYYLPDIRSALAGVRQITDQIVIHGMHTNLIFIPRIDGSGGLRISYSFVVCRGWVAYPLNIHSAYAWVRRITDRMFVRCMRGPGGLPTEYSFCIYRGQAD